VRSKEWPSFRGSFSSGVVDGAHPLTTWDVEEGINIKWKTAIPDLGHSSPIVWGDRVFVTTAVSSTDDYARGYDPNTGRERWRLGKHSIYATPTRIAGHGLIFLTSGSGNTVQPIYAVRPGASGDITLGDDQTSSDWVAWSKHRGGAFMPTPLLYNDLLYVSSDTGLLAAYIVQTGERVYQERLTRGGNYAASGVAADGRLYFASEDGQVVVVKAGRKFERLAENEMGEVIMATPAIADDMLVVRTQHHVVAVGDSTRQR
jgi:outer membrane protein assembly factor BamB